MAKQLIPLGLALALAVGGFVLRRLAARRLAESPAPSRWLKPGKRLAGLAGLGGAWWLVVTALSLVYSGAEHQGKKPPPEVMIFPKRVPLHLFGWNYDLSSSVLITWGIIAAVLVFALIFRFSVVPRMKDQPTGLQLLIETAVENLDHYIGTKLSGMSLSFGAYIFSTAILLVASALVELLGLRAPTADITMTLSLALITFFLINYCGFQRNGFIGRIRSLAGVSNAKLPPDMPLAQRLRTRLKNVAQPGTIGFPFRVISDLVVPLSLTCRLFGNMFGGMIIIDLLYWALDSKAIGIPSVVGLYFNIFHPLIQAFIFITLTLSYIEEAVGEE
ncbi:MAG: F0F1 ATP synthase subunit A [Oscillospiraceae bacterium]|nr:F0F1 ATP synthase subunit A [Oscillospiraceae bacterium]